MEQPPFFNQKVVWITGASSGIGEALAYAFSESGALIIISSRQEEDLNRVKQNCQAPPQNIFLLPLDLNDTEGIELKVQSALSRWGRIDYLIHNAGIACRALVKDTEMKIFRLIMETNYFGPVALTRAILPAMIQAGKGHIVAVSSLSGKYGLPKLSAYSASKHALHGFFDSLRTELIDTGISITIVIPGLINTQIIQRAVDGQGQVAGKNLEVNERGMPPVQCARKIIRAIQKGKQEAVIGGLETWSIYLNRYFPQQFNKLMARHPIKRLKKILFWRSR